MKWGMVPLAGLLGGCVVIAAAAVGAVAAVATYEYINGEGIMEYNRPPERVYEACVKVVERNGLRKTVDRFDRISGGRVEAKEARDDVTVVFRIEPLPENRTRLAIRRGFSDEEGAKRYHQYVQEMLGR